MSIAKQAFRRGFIAVSPLTPGVIPFALLAGATPVEAGLSSVTAMALSVFVFAGASQLALVQLMTDGAAFYALILTALVINLRFAMYSAALAPHFSMCSPSSRLVLPYLLTDQAFALSVSHFGDEHTPSYRVWFYLGIALPLWLLWQAGTLVGALLGAKIPPEWSMDFAIPLVFLSLIVPVVKDRSMFVAALVSAVVATAMYGWSPSLAILTGASSGILAGYVYAKVVGGEHVR